MKIQKKQLFFSALISLALLLWLFSARYYYRCYVLKDCDYEKKALDSAALDTLPLSLRLESEEGSLLEGYPEFYVDLGGTGLILRDEHKRFLRKTAEVLAQYPAAQLEIEGRVGAAERGYKAQGFQSLGLARAAAAADILSKEYQVPLEQIRFAEKQVPEQRPQAVLAFRIINYKAQSQAKAQEDTLFRKQVRENIRNISYSDMSAQFAANSGEFSPGPSFEVYVDSLQSYFRRRPKDYLIITGHTDSKGEKDYNLKLGQKRAEAVAAYLRLQGIDARIDTRSEGLNKLLLPDRQSDGSFIPEAMARNRRVDLQIQTGR